MSVRWILLITLLMFTMTSCSPSHTGRQDEDTTLSTPLQSPERVITEMPLTIDPSLQKLAQMAKEDLANRLNVAIIQIELLEAKAVVWPDASLGCPQPGMSYKQVPEDGALIILQVKGINYEYHNGGSRGLFLCERIVKNLNPPPKIDIFNLTPSKSNPDPYTPDNGIPPGEDQ